MNEAQLRDKVTPIQASNFDPIEERNQSQKITSRPEGKALRQDTLQETEEISFVLTREKLKCTVDTVFLMIFEPVYEHLV